MAKSIEIHQEKKKKEEGPTFKAITSLNGRTVELVRNGKKEIGVIVSKDRQGPSKNLAFQWKDKNGSACVSEITEAEIDKLLNVKK